MTTPDRPTLVLQLAADDPIGNLGGWLTGAGLELEVRLAPDLPATPDGYAGLVVLGGPMGARDDHRAPWLPEVRALLRAAVSGEVPTLAICLGAQILAETHGGRVIENPEGPEIGAQLIAKRASSATDPLFGPLPITPDVIQWHFDTISALPPGAVHLASSPVCENQAFRLGRLAWGVQFHLEATQEMLRDWAAEDAALLPDWDLDRVLDRAVGVLPDVAEVWEPFARSFADIVRDPSTVKPARGPVTSTAAPVTDPAAIRAALAAELTSARSPLPMPELRPDDSGDVPPQP